MKGKEQARQSWRSQAHPGLMAPPLTPACTQTPNRTQKSALAGLAQRYLAQRCLAQRRERSVYTLIARVVGAESHNLMRKTEGKP